MYFATPRYKRYNIIWNDRLYFLHPIYIGISHSPNIYVTACYGGKSYMHSISLSHSPYPLSLSHKWTLGELHFYGNIISKWRSLNCKLAGVFRKQVRLSTVERAWVHMVARLTKISNTLSRYFHIAQVGSSVSRLRLFISSNPVVFLCGQINIFKLCSCTQMKCDPLLHTCHNIDTGPAVSILLSSNLCDDTSSYPCIEHSTSQYTTFFQV